MIYPSQPSPTTGEGRNCVCVVFGSLQRPLIYLVFPETDIVIIICIARSGYAMSHAAAEDPAGPMMAMSYGCFCHVQRREMAESLQPSVMLRHPGKGPGRP
jgi:hypothetical protein